MSLLLGSVVFVGFAVFVGSFLLPLGCWVVGLLCLLGLLFLLDLFYFRWAVGSVVFVGPVVFVGSFYFRWAVGSLGCCVCWVCCFCWIFLLPLGRWVVVFVGSVVFVGFFYFRWAVGLARKNGSSC